MCINLAGNYACLRPTLCPACADGEKRSVVIFVLGERPLLKRLLVMAKETRRSGLDKDPEAPCNQNAARTSTNGLIAVHKVLMEVLADFQVRRQTTGDETGMAKVANMVAHGARRLLGQGDGPAMLSVSAASEFARQYRKLQSENVRPPHARARARTHTPHALHTHPPTRKHARTQVIVFKTLEQHEQRLDGLDARLDSQGKQLAALEQARMEGESVDKVLADGQAALKKDIRRLSDTARREKDKVDKAIRRLSVQGDELKESMQSQLDSLRNEQERIISMVAAAQADSEAISEQMLSEVREMASRITTLDLDLEELGVSKAEMLAKMEEIFVGIARAEEQAGKDKEELLAKLAAQKVELDKLEAEKAEARAATFRLEQQLAEDTKQAQAADALLSSKARRARGRPPAMRIEVSARMRRKVRLWE